MRILVIGGNGFIGSPLVRELLVSGHEVAVFHRHSDVGLAESGVIQIQGDRNRLSDYADALRRFSPDVIVDLILSSGDQARQLVDTAREIARRVIAISSMDVYRAWGVLREVEPGSIDPLPLTEDSPLRTTRRLYPPETVKMLQNVFTWLDERYDKIAVEEVIMSDPSVQGTILRLPMVYGPGDPLHRFVPLLKRFADGRFSILLPEDFAAWRGPRGYVENVAHAIAVVATSEQAAGRIYNVCEEPSLTELAWQTRIAKQMNWPGKFVILPREQTPKHLLLPGNAAQHVVASSERIRTELGYEEPVQIEEAYDGRSLGSSKTRQAPSILSSLITMLKTRLLPTCSEFPIATGSRADRNIASLPSCRRWGQDRRVRCRNPLRGRATSPCRDARVFGRGPGGAITSAGRDKPLHRRRDAAHLTGASRRPQAQRHGRQLEAGAAACGIEADVLHRDVVQVGRQVTTRSV
jgi:nucleoside-diphosphate-sugar epimerase